MVTASGVSDRAGLETDPPPRQQPRQRHRDQSPSSVGPQEARISKCLYVFSLPQRTFLKPPGNFRCSLAKYKARPVEKGTHTLSTPSCAPCRPFLCFAPRLPRAGATPASWLLSSHTLRARVSCWRCKWGGRQSAGGVGSVDDEPRGGVLPCRPCLRE